MERALKVFEPEVMPGDVLIENSPRKEGGDGYDLQHLKIWNTKFGVWEDQPKKLDAINDYLKENRQAYILAHPGVAVRLKRLLLETWGKVFDATLNQPVGSIEQLLSKRFARSRPVQRRAVS